MIPVYYGKPPKVFDEPNCVSMSHAAFRFHDCLWGLSDRRCSLEFEATDEDIIQRTGLSKGSLAIARKDLSRRGLIICRRRQRGYLYTLNDVETRKPYSGDPKVKKPYQKKKRSSSQIAQQANETPAVVVAAPAASMATVVWIKTTKPAGVLPALVGDASEEGLDSCDTSFPNGRRNFGFDKLFKKS
jgi:hypothetical protein